MILSVSRRTDIPNYYSDWFFNRIREGFLYVRNPMNPHQISRIPISPELVDCIVFWTKNPGPMLERLEELKDYMYYFQFTLTPYGKDIEPNLPDKKDVLIPVFKKLSEKTGRERVIWRYDPILVNDRYTAEYHQKAFQEIAESLAGYTDRVVISFVDLYAKTKRNMRDCPPARLDEEKMKELAAILAHIAKKNHMEIESCGNGCRYCYANFSDQRVKSARALYRADSPLLCGTVLEGDIITERKVKSLKKIQISLFD